MKNKIEIPKSLALTTTKENNTTLQEDTYKPLEKIRIPAIEQNC